MTCNPVEKQLKGRDFNEENRSATALELFYDLIFVVAIANLATAFHHSYSNNHIGQGVESFIIVFLAIWWAWNQYTWFASSFDNNSVSFRLVTLWQMIGALIIAAGVEQAVNGQLGILIFGYVIIRVSGIYLWLKVSHDNEHLKTTGRRYAIGILLCQIGWVSQYFFLEFSYVVLFALYLAEFSVPYYAESHTQTDFHPEHIEERLGLLTIIVLGESILASANSIKTLVEHFTMDILMVAIGCILTLFGIWWLYFNSSIEHKLRKKQIAFAWGYGHFIIFASAAAIGALVSVNIDVLTDHASISIGAANLGFAAAVALYLFGLWISQERFMPNDKSSTYFILLVAAAALGLGFLPQSVLSIGVLIVLAVIYRQYRPLGA